MNEDWRDAARCKDQGDLFDGEGVRHATPRVRDALRLCAGCPVRSDCLHWGLTEQHEYVLPVWNVQQQQVVVLVHQHHMRQTTAIFGGTLLEDRRRVAHLPVQIQEAVLAQAFRFLALGDMQVRLPLKGTGPRRCVVCDARLPMLARSDRMTCSPRCKEKRKRRRRRRAPLIRVEEFAS